MAGLVVGHRGRSIPRPRPRRRAATTTGVPPVVALVSTVTRPFRTRTRSSMLLDPPAAPLAHAVVVDLGRVAAAVDGADRDADPLRLSLHGLVQRLADDLVERDLRLLAEPLAGLDVRRDGIRYDASICSPSALHGRGEPVVAQDERLDREREVAQRADRVALALERGRDHLRRPPRSGRPRARRAPRRA